MNELKKFLVAALGLTATMGLTACDVEECDEAGVCTSDSDGGGGVGGSGNEGGGGSGNEGGTPGTEFTWVLIIDDSAEENMNGTPGADICGVSSSCGTAVAALLSEGDGELCDAIDEARDCSADRTDPNAARDDGSSCEAASAPSDYVSLGMGGTLSVQFSADQTGCTVEVVELVGNQVEGYEVYVCDDSDAASNCVNDGASIGGAANGGSVSVQVP